MSSTLTETSTFTASVITPSDGDDVNASSISGGLQPLTNRTRYLLENAVTAPAPITFVRMVPLSRFQNAGTGNWKRQYALGVSYFSCLNANTENVIGEIQLPDGATLTQVRAGIRIFGGSPSVGMKLTVGVQTADKTGTVGPSTSALFGTAATGTTSTSEQNPLSVTGSYTATADTKTVNIAITASDSASGAYSDTLSWVEVTYTSTDPKAGQVSL